VLTALGAHAAGFAAARRCLRFLVHVIFTKFLKLFNYTLSQPLDNLSFRTGALCLSQICTTL